MDLKWTVINLTSSSLKPLDNFTVMSNVMTKLWGNIFILKLILLNFLGFLATYGFIYDVLLLLT